jgi:zinc transport system permease protein
MADLVDIQTLPILIRAILAGMAVGYLGGYLGVFVIQRGMSFMGSGLSHAAFGGVALGLLLEMEPLYVAIPFTVIVALAIDFIRKRTTLGSDTSIGILFAVSMALGLLFLSMKSSFTTDAFAYLFGSILAVRESDLYIAGALVLASTATWRLWGKWALASLDEEMARGDGLRISRDDTLLSLFLAVTIVVSIKVVGIVLISAFLVIPAATGRVLSKTFRSMTLISIAIGTVTAATGLVVNFFVDAPAGAVIILVQTAVFGIAMVFARFYP